MTRNEKINLIERFEKLSFEFDDVLELSNELILYRPFADAWSIKEQIVHCMEVDIANFHRYRRAIAQPDTPILSFDQVWTMNLDYQSSDLKLTMDLIKMVRAYMACHLKTIADCDWTKYAYIHDKKGRINLEEALCQYSDHVDFHRKLINRNIELFDK
ncbi:MAG: DinB family protein [Bacillota bacterium]|nr:DinB family protein [Bacillota bacterium]